jgi:hypothetical protein
VFAIPHSIKNQKSLINNSPQAPVPCPGHVGAGALTCSAERSSAIGIRNPSNVKSIDTASRSQLSTARHWSTDIPGCAMREGTPLPLVYENNALAVTSAPRSLSNKGL